MMDMTHIGINSNTDNGNQENNIVQSPNKENLMNENEDKSQSSDQKLQHGKIAFTKSSDLDFSWIKESDVNKESEQGVFKFKKQPTILNFCSKFKNSPTKKPADKRKRVSSSEEEEEIYNKCSDLMANLMVNSVKDMLGIFSSEMTNIMHKVTDTVDKHLQKTTSILDTVVQRTSETNRLVVDKISEQNVRIETIETNNMNEMSRLQDQIDGLNTECFQINETLVDNDNEMSVLRERIDHQSKKTDLCLGKLHRATEEIRRLKEENLDLQYRSMKNNLLFTNIEELQTESHVESNKDTEDALCNFLINKLKVPSNEVDSIMFDSVHRLGKPKYHTSRPIVARFISRRFKENILRYATNLDGEEGYQIMDQYPAEYRKRRQQLYPLFEDGRRQNVPVKWMTDKLKIGNEIHYAPNDFEVMDTNMDVDKLALAMKPSRTNQITVLDSSFQGHAVLVTSTDEIQSALAAIAMDNKVGRATHIAYAYRIKSGDELHINFEDDKEYGAGLKILSVLEEMKMENVLVAVSRWFGQTELGYDRFNQYKNAARAALHIFESQY